MAVDQLQISWLTHCNRGEVESSHRPSHIWILSETRTMPAAYAPWHFLNFFSLPHGQGSLRPTSFNALRTGSW